MENKIKNRISKNQNLREELIRAGYLQIDKIYSNIMIQIVGTIVSLIFAILFFTSYNYRWRNYTAAFDIEYYHIFFLIIGLILYCIIHELLHALGWMIFCKNKKRNIEIGFIRKTLTPYCYCAEPLTLFPFSFGLLLPFLVLAVGQFIICLFIPNFLLLMLSMLNALIAGGDLLIFFDVLISPKGLILTHPIAPGVYIFKNNI